MTSGLYVALIMALAGQQAPAESEFPESATVRLDVMKGSLASYSLHASENQKDIYRVRSEPVLRFTNPVGGMKDGAVFLWVDGTERPAAAVQVYWTARQQRLLQEFSSLSTDPMVADSAEGPVWRPAKAGVTFKSVPDAPRPAVTATQRLRQMHSIAEGFRAEHFYYRKVWNTLRLLSKPFARYGKEGSEIEDGALFCFAQGTEPEVLLMLEAHSGNAGPEWQYAFAPLTAFEVKASRKGIEVWSKPPQANGSAKDPNNTFHVRRYRQERR